MPRPKKYRYIKISPSVTYFKPRGIPLMELEEVALNLEELEALRLHEVKNLTEEKAAKKIKISRTTFHRILVSAQKKVAEALVLGKAIRIEGQDYKLIKMKSMKNHKILLLNEETIKKLISIDEVIEVVESAFKEKGLGRVQMPAKLYLFYKKYNGDLRTMPSYLEALDISGVKVVNVHPDNRKKYNLPTVMAIIILVDPKNGAPIAIMGGTEITNLRTGAAGGISAKYLAKKDSQVVGLVGAGSQAKTQLAALLSIYQNLKEVKVWSRSAETRKSYIEEMKDKVGNIKMTSVEKVEEAVKGADIVVSTTPSREPLISHEWAAPGMHFVCIGADAPGKEELDSKILKKAKIVVDDWEQASHSGEINVPLAKGIITQSDIWAEIGEVVAGIKEGRTSPQEITLFTSTGLAIQDSVTADLVYKKAKAQNLGDWVKII